jgi:hypothetical protein
MKNPLVDALRQARVPSDYAAPTRTAASPTHTEGEELKLFDSQVIDPSAIIANDDLDAGLYTDTSLAFANDDAEMQNASPASMAAMPGRVPTDNSGMPRLAGYSPWLCLGLMLAFAGGYFSYQQLGGRYLNVDLQALPAQVDTAHRPLRPIDPGATRFTNPFQLIVEPQSETPQ